MKKAYDIGQVLFVVLAKSKKVYPVKVVEVITKRTLSGEAVEYMLQAGSDPATKVSLDTLEGEVFESVEKVQTVLNERAKAQIVRLVTAAAEKANEWYGQKTPVFEPVTPLEDVGEVDDDGRVLMKLDDGTVVRAKLPSTVIADLQASIGS